MNALKCVFLTALIGWVSCGVSEESPVPGAQPKQVERRQSVVEWETALQHAPFDDSQLSAQQTRTLEEASLPILLPNEAPSVRAALMTVGPGWYSASMKHEAFSVVVSGSTNQLRVEGVEPPALPEYGKDDLQVVRGEGIAELIFTAYGAVYTISVECEDPENDEHCTEDAYALGMADELLLSHANRP